MAGPRSGTRRRLRGSVTLWLIAATLVVGSVALIAWYVSSIRTATPEDAPLTRAAFRGVFDHVVLEHGEVESSSNVEIKSEVKARNSDGMKIISVIPEGERVVKGDWLVSLDSSALEDELKQQRVTVNATRALMITARAVLEQAQIGRTEYLRGTFKQEERQIESEVLIAEEKLSRANEAALFSQRLAAQGFQSALQLKADLFAVEQSQVELDLAQGRLETLREITREKMLVGFDSQIEAAEATYESEDDSYQEELAKLKETEDQIDKCRIIAPTAGQVVYANIHSRRGGSSEFVVEEGAVVRERQTIIRLPDPSKMQIKATVNESQITLVEPDMDVDIRIGAYDEEQILRGRVTKVNKYAEPGSWFSSQVKEYATYVEIYDPPVEIRSGMTAEVRIFVERLDHALQVPVQAVYEKKGHTYCLVKKSNGWDTRSIQMGATNDKTVTIVSGLDEGEHVVLNPRSYEHLLELPDVAPRPSGNSNSTDRSVSLPRTRSGLASAESTNPDRTTTPARERP